MNEHIWYWEGSEHVLALDKYIEVWDDSIINLKHIASIRTGTEEHTRLPVIFITLLDSTRITIPFENNSVGREERRFIKEQFFRFFLGISNSNYFAIRRPREKEEVM